MSAALDWARRHFEVLAFASGLAAFVFLAGVLVGHTRAFPYPSLNAAYDVVTDWRENWRHYLGVRSNFALPTTRTEGGVTVHDPALASDGFTFVTAYRAEGYHGYLLDMRGEVVHRWDTGLSRIWPDRDQGEAVDASRLFEAHGAHLYDNGDVLVNVGGTGTAKLDRCSEVLWTVDRNTHHDVEPLPGGGAIMPSRIKRTEAHAGLPLVHPGPSGFYWDDTILRVGADGRVIDEHSVIDILFRSGWGSMLLSGPGSGKAVKDEDPIHLNDVEVLSPEMASAFPIFEAGDMMISLRHLNSILVVGGDDWRVKWTMTGPFLGQHDPDFLPNGRIMVYDNRITGEWPRLGNTRLIEIDPATRKVAWTFEGDADQAFYARKRGEKQLLPNGNVLIADPLNGRLLEIAPAHGNKTVWEWVNLIEPGSVGLVTDIQRVPRDGATWLDQPCSGPIGVASGGRPKPDKARG
jgi:hypothetical protein